MLRKAIEKIVSEGEDDRRDAFLGSIVLKGKKRHRKR